VQVDLSKFDVRGRYGIFSERIQTADSRKEKADSRQEAAYHRQ
jgi:hypothetical protein